MFTPRVARMPLPLLRDLILLSPVLMAGCMPFERSPDGPVAIELGHHASIASIEASPDGRLLRVQTAVGIEVWNIRTGRQLWKQTDWWGGEVSPSGRLLLVRIDTQRTATSSEELVDFETGRKVARLRGDPGEQRAHAIHSRAFSHDGRLLAFVSEQLDIVFYPLGDLDRDGHSGEPLDLTPQIVHAGGSWDKPFDGPHAPGVSFSPDDRELFTFSTRRSVMERWSTEPPYKRLSYSKYQAIESLSPDGVSADGERAWECGLTDMTIASTRPPAFSRQQRFAPELIRPSGGSYSEGRSRCRLSPDGLWAAIGLNFSHGTLDLPYHLSLWRADGVHALQDLGYAHEDDLQREREEQVAALSFSPDSRYLYVLDEAANLHLYALGDPLRVAQIDAATLGFDHGSSHPKLHAGNSGVAIGIGHRVVWIPEQVPDPP